ncbi:MarR family winged helix-turn-helix transcriptional regulator [Lutispora saccharofermentans]|uniref:MarR family transcriptional regulator n=1 Tax=Lutispora saccharofermentans TaxID=3024236 RepID=A0ABT1NC35_9FIRM|nr:MarR family transcriptional regulator [Lutispora saccharofermentans]MCQ1528820.1 MarR family transcriptional regulator [Lutispora saccharofermentans]
MDIPTKEYLFGSIFLLANKLQTLGDAFLEQMTLKQWLLLIMIFNMENKQPSVTEIAEFIGSTRQNVRKMLGVLSAKGYVTLCVNKQDKRNLSVALTEKTFLFFTQFEAKGAAFLEQLFDGINADLQESARITMETLFNNLERMKMQYEKSDRHI